MCAINGKQLSTALQKRLELVAVFVWVVSAFVLGCGDSKSTSKSDASSCSSGGQGTLIVSVAGLPTSVAASVVVTGPSGVIPFAQSSTVPAGVYAATAATVTVADPLVRRAFLGTVVEDDGDCVDASGTGTLHVVYTEILSSNKVWLGNANGTDPLLGYNSSIVRSSGNPAASVAAETSGSQGLAFDREGNLWVAGATTEDLPLLQYSSMSLGSSGTKTASISITSSVFSGGFPRATAIAFDSDGNLWTNVVWANKVVKFAAAQIRATNASATPAVELSEINGPQELAFDAAHNLWVAEAGENRILRFNAASLSVSGVANPGLKIVAMSPPPVIGTLSNPNAMAFDGAGNLWVGYEGVLVKFTSSDLAGTGTKEVTPAIQIDISVLALPEQIALDEGGGMWMAGSAGNFVRFAPAQLAASGMPTPEVTISGSQIGSAGDFAIFPAPAGLPLYHALP